MLIQNVHFLVSDAPGNAPSHVDRVAHGLVLRALPRSNGAGNVLDEIAMLRLPAQHAAGARRVRVANESERLEECLAMGAAVLERGLDAELRRGGLHDVANGERLSGEVEDGPGAQLAVDAIDGEHVR